MSTQTLEKAKSKGNSLQNKYDYLKENLEQIIEHFKVEEHPPLTILLTDTSETSWIKEGTERSATPERMSFPGLYNIMPTSKIAVKDESTGYKLIDIRYVQGCPSLDPQWQKDNGIEPEKSRDNIWIPKGTEVYLYEGDDATLYLYLKMYQGNRNNPFKPPTAVDEFEELVEATIAEAKNVSFDEQYEAMSIISTLREKGATGFEYDIDKLQVFANLFGLNKLDSVSEKFQALVKMSQEQPEKIINSVGDKKRSYYANVIQARDFGIIKFDEDKVYFVNNNSVILPFKVKMEDKKKFSTVVDYLMTEEGDIFYKQIILDISTFKDGKLTGPK